jgi:integrase
MREEKGAGSLARLGHLLDVHESTILETFKEFLIVDLRQSEKTVYEKVWYISKFLKTLNRPLKDITREDIRQYLKNHVKNNATYKNTLGSMKTFFRDFLEMPYLIQTFKFPRQPFQPKIIVTKEELQRFYNAIDSTKEKALFMLYATSGLRRKEILSLKLTDIDFNNRMIIPKVHSGETKKSFVSFYNAECEQVLMEYLKARNGNGSDRLFPFAREKERRLWREAREKTGINITPQRLREFFCMEMSEQGVQDRFIDAFCGRTPKSILAKCYTDYSPKKLKEVYDKANLRLFS